MHYLQMFGFIMQAQNVNYLCRTLHVSMVYVCGTYKTNMLRNFILCGAKVSENY